MKLIVYDTKIISPEYCRPKDKETKRKEHVCNKKIKAFWIKKKKKVLHLQEQRRVYPSSEGVWLHRVPAWIFCMKMVDRMYFLLSCEWYDIYGGSAAPLENIWFIAQ